MRLASFTYEPDVLPAQVDPGNGTERVDDDQHGYEHREQVKSFSDHVTSGAHVGIN